MSILGMISGIANMLSDSAQIQSEDRNFSGKRWSEPRKRRQRHGKIKARRIKAKASKAAKKKNRRHAK